MKAQDKIEFREYCLRCSDYQLLGVLEKEVRAGRKGYRNIALREAHRRDVDVGDVMRSLIIAGMEYPDASALVAEEWGIDQEAVSTLYEGG